MIFLRHAVTNAGPDVCYGRTDVGLASEASSQMQNVVQSIVKPIEIRASPLSRCRILADRIGDRFGLDPIIDARLVEYDFGDWEGRRWPDIPRSETEPWIADMFNAAPPGGESFCELVERMRAALADCSEASLVVCHAGPIRAARMILTGASFEEVFAWRVPFCEPIEFSRVAA